MTDADWPQITRLDERAFGPGRFARSAYRLREGVPPDYSLSFVAHVGTFLVGSNIITPILAGGRSALLLGPLTVDPSFRSRGIGEALMRRSLTAAKSAGHTLVLLVGDAPYYAKAGFKPVPPGRLAMPGPVDPGRVLACELADGALEGVAGSISRAW
ncbi:MAG: GNAT family N-acetyltransferase [Beijerinckiaceae bacterium]